MPDMPANHYFRTFFLAKPDNRLAPARGFTLLELLVVIVIIGLLATYVGPKYFAQLGKSEVTVAKAQIEAFEKALDTYRLDVGRYPATEEGLTALVTKPASAARWNDPLLNAGLSIVECLEALLEKESDGTTRSVLMRLLAGLREGKRFSAVLSEQSSQFPALYIGIIKAAEGTSDLPRALKRFIDYQQRIDAVRGKIVSAAIYPIILFTVGGVVSSFLIGYVVPRFAEVYQGAGRNLPWMSQLLLDWGRFAAAHARVLLPCVIIGALILFLAARRFFMQGGGARLMAMLPGMGERARIYELSRLYLTLGMLLEGGIPIIPAMQTVAGIVSVGIRAGLQTAQEAIQSGTPLSTAFEANRLTTFFSLRMLRVGEHSGELGQMLSQSAAFYDGEISRWIDRFIRIFEPLLMAAIGLVVGAIVVLLYMPIFDLAGSLS